ncbi:hypothetical protein L9F63_008425, partial [Diploptera punctata]
KMGVLTLFSQNPLKTHGCKPVSMAGLTNPIRPFVNLQGSRCRVASSVRYTVPKYSISAVSAVEVFTDLMTLLVRGEILKIG